jgi:hypothetical protein
VPQFRWNHNIVQPCMKGRDKLVECALASSKQATHDPCRIQAHIAKREKAQHKGRKEVSAPSLTLTKGPPPLLMSTARYVQSKTAGVAPPRSRRRHVALLHVEQHVRLRRQHLRPAHAGAM